MNHRSIPKVGIGGPVGSGKTALIKRLVPPLQEEGYDIGLIANDILTQEDATVLKQSFAGEIPGEFVAGVETGACPHTGIREDPSMNLAQINEFLDQNPELDIVIIESGGDNLAATFNPELADYFIFVISVAEGEDIPRKKGPGITEADLLVINKIDLTEHVDVDLGVMESDAEMVRDGAPFVFTNCKNGENIDKVIDYIRDNVLFE